MKKIIKPSLIVFLLLTVFMSYGQVTPSIRIGCGVYSANDRLRWKYSSELDTSFENKKVRTTHKYMPVELRCGFNSIVRVSVDYAYGTLDVNVPETPLFYKKCVLHQWGGSVDFMIAENENLKYYFGISVKSLKMKDREINPFYVQYQTPYTIHSSWKGYYLGLDFEFDYEFRKIPLTIDAIVGYKIGGTSMQSTSFGSVKQPGKDIDGSISYSGKALEIGVSYRLQRKKNT